MTTRPTGACLVLVTQVNMVRGPHPTEYCRGELKAAHRLGRRLRSVAPPARAGPLARKMQGLSSGARGGRPSSKEASAKRPRLPRSGSCSGGRNAGAAGPSAILRARQLGSQALLFAPQRVRVNVQSCIQPHRKRDNHHTACNAPCSLLCVCDVTRAPMKASRSQASSQREACHNAPPRAQTSAFPCRVSHTHPALRCSQQATKRTHPSA